MGRKTRHLHKYGIIVSFAVAFLLYVEVRHIMNPKQPDSPSDTEKVENRKRWEKYTLDTHTTEELITTAKKVNQNENFVALCVINGAYLPFLLSWLCNTANMDVHRHLLIVISDENAVQQVRFLWPDLYVMSITIPEENLNKNLTFGEAGYLRYLLVRIEIMYTLINNDINVVLFEADAVWFKNPLALVTSMNEYDIIGSTTNTHHLAFGFMFLRSNKIMIKIFGSLVLEMRFLIVSLQDRDAKEDVHIMAYDQDYLAKNLEKHEQDVRVNLLNETIVADGFWYTSKWYLQLGTYILNNNGIKGNGLKIKRAKENGHWLILEDYTCNWDKIKAICH
ncbi:unnamed protein product [Owenia fusiformis]|uniref:Uncharacterized protein n=1 Tax=Owenia fusiformis TaxID=6347 RepID=A0A8J1UAG6_OWEFU|nr:unnamed protein product [Owenia fusiformis]